MIKDKIENIHERLVELSRDIFENPELGNEEYFACSKHIEILERYGFSVEKQYLDIKTAFRAVYDTGKNGATVAFLSEYDALPNLGHGCGHNILGTVSTGSGIILKETIENIGGKIIVIGTPAEEMDGSKVDMVEKGAFDDIDFVLMAHPDNRHYESGKSLSMKAIQFEYYGKTSHAASSPEKGINALDGVIGLFNNINAIREHIKSDARVHGIINHGGDAPNVVPDYASAKFYIRATTKSYLDELEKKVINCANASALSSGATIKISEFEKTLFSLITNQTMSDIYSKNLMRSGCNKLYSPKQSCGSIDVGNVSHVCPVIHPYFDITGDGVTPAHTVEFASFSVSDYANEQMKITIEALVKTAIEIMSDLEVLEKIKKEFSETEK